MSINFGQLSTNQDKFEHRRGPCHRAKSNLSLPSLESKKNMLLAKHNITWAQYHKDLELLRNFFVEDNGRSIRQSVMRKQDVKRFQLNGADTITTVAQ